MDFRSIPALSGPDHCTTPTRVGTRDTDVCPPLPKDHDHDESLITEDEIL